MSDCFQTAREKNAVIMEAAALDFRDQRNRVLNTARELRSQAGPQSFIRDAEKIAADLNVLESCAWRYVENNR